MAPPGKIIQLTWMTFNLEQSYDCLYDNLQIFDNNTDIGLGGLLGKYCGYTLPPVMLSSSNMMTLDFNSDNTIHGDGFLVSYTFINENNGIQNIIFFFQNYFNLLVFSLSCKLLYSSWSN